MTLDPTPLLDAARAGRPWHQRTACPYHGNCINPREVGERIGVHRSLVEKWRRGARQVAEAHAERYAEALDLHPLDLWPELIDRYSRPCTWCRTPFIPTRASHLYCTKACAQAARRRRPEPPPRACDECGATFQPGTAAQRFCGPTCAYEGHKRAGRDRYHTDPDHRAQVLERNATYRQEACNSISLNQARWRATNKIRIDANARAYRQANQAAIRAYQRAWYAANADRLNAHRRALYATQRSTEGGGLSHSVASITDDPQQPQEAA